MPETAPSGPTDKFVLIVDDDEDMQEFLAFTLRAEGFLVEQALNGREALRKIQQLLPDLVLLDLMFPRHGGEKILSLMQGGLTASTPVIVMTGCDADGLLRRTLVAESNVAGFFEKPINAEQLVAEVHRALNTRPLRNRDHATSR